MPERKRNIQLHFMVSENERAQIRRQHGQYVEHHPLWLDARLFECFQNFETLGVFLDLEFRTR